MVKHPQKTPSTGSWEENEITHINVSELEAIQFGALTYCKDKNFKHRRIMSDKTTAISYINKKMAWHLMNVMKLQKKSGFGVLVKTYTCMSAANIPVKENFEVKYKQIYYIHSQR